MAYGTIKVDTVTFTNAGVDKSVTLSGLVQNPTFSGNVTVTGTLSGVTVTGTTANFTSGNFTNISGGTHTITSGVFAAGSAASPSITFTGDLNTGIYSPGADQVAISTGGSGRLFVDASGRVGVGSAPSVGNGIHATINTNNYGTAFVLQNANVNGWAAEMQFLGITTTDTQAKIGALATGPGSNSGALAFYTANAGSYLERLRITSAGLVGVGTSSPSYRLHAVAASEQTNPESDSGAYWPLLNSSSTLNTCSALALGTNNDLGTAIVAQRVGTNNEHVIKFQTRNSSGSLGTRMTLTGSGLLGIGTTSPGQALSVAGNISSSAVGTNYVASSSQGVTTSYLITDTSGGNIQVDGAWPIRFTTNSNERARIDSSGNLLVGTTTFGNNRRGVSITPASIQIANNSGSAALFLSALNTNVASNIGGVITFDAVYRNSDKDSTQIAYIKGLRENATENAWASYLSFETSPGTTAPVERMRIDSSGRLLVGTSSTSSASALVVQNNSSGNGVGVVRINYSTDSPGANDTLGIVSFGDNTHGEYASVAGLRDGGTWSGSSKPTRLVFSTTADGASSPTERMRITNDGKIGIANNGVIQQGSGIGGGSAAGILELYNGGTGNTTLENTGAFPILFKTNGSERARIDSSGRLLVGTSSSPSNAQGSLSKLIVQGYVGANTEVGIVSIQRGEAATSITADEAIGQLAFNSSDGGTFAHIQASADGAAGNNDYPGRLVFSTTADGASSPTERMRIGSDGRVFVACSSSPSASVFGTMLSSNLLTESNKSSVNTTSANVHWVFFNPNGAVGTISTNGSATAYNTSSDYRLKENVTPVTDGITRLQQLKPSRFNFIADPAKTVDGFIAHEVQAVVPEAITGEKDAVDDDGNPVYQGIDQSKLVPLLTAALQEVVAEINALKDRVAALEGV